MEQNLIQTTKKQQIKAFNDIVNNAYYQNQLQKLFGKKSDVIQSARYYLLPKQTLQ